MATEAQAISGDWGGGTLPYRVGHRKLGMWLFIMSDSLTFSALLIGYAYVRASNVWPTPFKFYPSIIFSSVMTLVLLSSSMTMVMAVSASSRGQRSSGSVLLYGRHLRKRHGRSDDISPIFMLTMKKVL